MSLLFNLPLSATKDVEVDTSSATPLTIRSWNGIRQETKLTTEEAQNLISLLEANLDRIKQELGMKQ